ncbi:hypothetical protein [Pyrinomonas methylaliphatogenes]|uniref:Uncharacterized protein n=1 Tax=Pyrinomonas methylaliphatogenes TaxID=454194 RepID=A0A0B6WUK7_9BACT|nr:hypothetical protein [Pyrinomonas methylaliphatogenes]CDM64686.1 hypothetical protein PYK22_00681 [Pyrinomonas methylaliphatogenes]
MGDKTKERTAPFYLALEEALRRRGLTLNEVCPPDDALARRALEEYGAIFLACERVCVPHRVIFRDEAEVGDFQQRAGARTEIFGGVPVTLQPAAMEALILAREELQGAGLDLTPRGGLEASRRTYSDTLRLWQSRVLPALRHWTDQGRLLPEEAERIRRLSPHEQAMIILDYEARGLFFSKCFSKPIMRSVALPGASQHLTMLALDINEFQDARVRHVLMRHGWFQTVLDDLPHFTFLGLEENELPHHGLKSIRSADQIFWTPDLGDENVSIDS